MTSPTINSHFVQHISTDLILIFVPRIEAPEQQDNYVLVSSIFARAYESFLINSHDQSFLILPLSNFFFLSRPRVASSSAAAAEHSVVLTLGRCITLNEPENGGIPPQ